MYNAYKRCFLTSNHAVNLSNCHLLEVAAISSHSDGYSRRAAQGIVPLIRIRLSGDPLSTNSLVRQHCYW